MFKLNEVIRERLQDNHRLYMEKISNRSWVHVMFPECSRPVLPSDINREDLAMMISIQMKFIQRLIKSVNLQLSNSKQFEFKNKHFDQNL